MALNLEAYRAALVARDRATAARNAATPHADAPATTGLERALALAERIESHPDIVDAMALVGADVGALVEGARAAVGRAIGEHSLGHDRTCTLESRARTVNGSVPVQRTMGRGTEADAYERLDGAPVGTPETLETHRAEQGAALDAARWALHNARAEAGEVVTRKSLRNAKREAARARARSPLAALATLNARMGGPR